MGFISDEAVEVVEVLEETYPRLADPVKPIHARPARHWAQAVALFESAASDAAMTRADWVTVHDHRQQITRDVQDQVGRLHRAEERPEPELLRLAADILEEVVRPGVSGYQWDVDRTQTVAADLRALADDPAAAGPDLRARLWAADDALSTALQVDGAVGVDAAPARPASGGGRRPGDHRRRLSAERRKPHLTVRSPGFFRQRPRRRVGVPLRISAPGAK